MTRTLRTLCVLALVSCAPTAVTAAETARGHVYVDADADGRRDTGEAGLADVAVSNGHRVVKTDAQGRWQLEVEEGDVIFVVKPSGYRTQLAPNGVPRFYHVHRPGGTPAELDLAYPGLAPTGPLPDSIDFGLVPVDEPESFDVILFADTQPQSHVELDYIREDVLNELAGTDAAFGMTLGDFLYDDLSLFPRYLDLLGALGVPWYNVPGNHELNFLSPNDEHSLATFQRYLGPTTYSFTYGRAHFVVLDDVVYRGTSRGEEDAPVRGAGGYYGGLSERQLDWLEADLALVPDDHLVVVTMHIPLRSHVDPEAPYINVLDRDRLFRILGERDHVLSFAGHTHLVEHHHFDESDDWPGDEPLHHHVLATVCGSWWTGPHDERGVPVTVQRDGVPNGYTILSIDANEAVAHYRAAGHPADHQMRIGFDRAYHQLGAALLESYRPGELQVGPLLFDGLPSTDVYVNLFNGGPRSRVAMRVDDGPWVEMVREVREDPWVLEHMARHADTMKGWVRPVATTHLWFAGLPTEGLDAGVHRIEVRATDEYGTEHRGHRIFEVRR